MTLSEWMLVCTISGAVAAFLVGITESIIELIKWRNKH